MLDKGKGEGKRDFPGIFRLPAVKFLILALFFGAWIKIGIDLLFAWQLMGSFAATVYSAATAVVFKLLYGWLFADGKF